MEYNGIPYFAIVTEFLRQFNNGQTPVEGNRNVMTFELAKALRSIQQNDLPQWDPTRRVLGVIRPTAEIIGKLTRNGHVGLLATEGTVKSQSYNLEIAKLWPNIKVTGQACPFWVPLIEYNEADSPGADYFVKKDIEALLSQCHNIDTVILGCTHYPLLVNKIKKYMPKSVHIIEQGGIVAESLKDYLHRHPEMEQRCSKGGTCEYFTTEDAEKFSEMGSIFVNEKINAKHVTL